MKAVMLGALVAAVLANMAGAQPFQRTELFRQAYPEGFETILVRTVVAKDAVVPRHIHPGLETGYILAGEGRLQLEGQPDRIMKPGDSVMMPAKIPHAMTNIGPEELVIVSTYVIEAGQPVATMVK